MTLGWSLKVVFRFIGFHVIYSLFKDGLGRRATVELGTRKSIKRSGTEIDWTPAGDYAQFQTLASSLVPLRIPQWDQYG